MRIVGQLFLPLFWLPNLLVIPLTLAMIVLTWPPRLIFQGLGALRRNLGAFFLAPVQYLLYPLLLGLYAMFEVLFFLMGLPYAAVRSMTSEVNVLQALIEMRTASWQSTCLQLKGELAARQED